MRAYRPGRMVSDLGPESEDAQRFAREQRVPLYADRARRHMPLFQSSDGQSEPGAAKDFVPEPSIRA